MSALETVGRFSSPVDGKRIVVMGGGGGIGRAVVTALVGEGAWVAAVDLGKAALDSVETGAPDRTLRLVADASDPEAMRAAVDAVESEFGRIDALVNTVGLFHPGDFVDSTPADWDLAIRVNLLGVMTATWAVLPGMLARGSGAIVHFASTAGEYGSIRPAAAYAAAKGGVIAFTKSLAREVAGQGVRVNCISPGPVRTAMFAADTPDADGSSRTLVGRMGTPADLVPAVRYLASDDSAYVTGEVMRVNGGSLI
jgi:NAD(P)-dependent dehydrogenase (short-subunit alcohol dehydrogenase family)